MVFQDYMKKILKIKYRWINQIFDPIFFVKGIVNYFWFLCDWIKYSKLKNSELLSFINSYPRIHDKTKITKFDSHYFYQGIWATKKIYKTKVKKHIDVGSQASFVGVLTTFSEVVFIDVRPLEVSMKGLKCVKGDILKLPFKDNSIQSISCLHVAEHIGLGRYGDKLDVLGTKKAIKELQRVLAPGGHLYFSLPIGVPRTEFNAHRIHSPKQILEYFDELNLVEFSGVNDDGVFMEDINTEELEFSKYACGFFLFSKT